MKLKALHIIFALCLVCFTTLAQTYVIPDDGFKQCLIERYPAVLDGGNELDISAASNLEGELYCPGFGIVDADGLQHFTSLDTLTMRQNSLQNIDEISQLENLMVIVINDNEITSLPDLSNFNQLTSLVANSNFITTPPGLPINSSLTNLDLKENFLSSFPDVSNQTQLENLIVSRNENINTIPALPSLPNLKHFQCYICGLSEVPDISLLPNLEYLDIGYNQITELPDFSGNSQLTTVYANNNALTSFANMSVLPNLVKARLYNNYLSFEDFEPLLVNNDYDEVYKIIPQNEFHNPLAGEYSEFDSISFKTTVANNASGEIYSWYKDDLLFWEGNLDTLHIDSAQIEDSGEYYFTITHPTFPDLTLSSWKTAVQVNSCLEPDNFDFSVTGANCQKAGTIIITPGEQPQSGLSYSLQSKVSKRVFHSTNGVFTNLNNPEYTLYAQASERCIKLIDNSISLPIEECKEVFFSPNNDGVDDTFYFDQQGEAKIYNKWGQLIKTLNIPADWNGQLNNNEVITPGYYTIDINNGEEIMRLSVIY